MNIHEFQAKAILQKYGIPIPPFFVVSSIGELEELLKAHPFEQAVLKVQIHAGGRGKAGGIKFAHNKEEILSYAKELLGKKIVNNQTGPLGIVSNQLLITAPVDIVKEYYLGVIMDRQHAQAVLIVSPSGGMDIEQVAHESPEKVLRLPIPIEGVMRSYQLIRIAKFMGWKDDIAKEGIKIIQALIKTFFETDASLLEINPLVETEDHKLFVLDTKLTIDDNALFRQPEIKELFDPTQMSPYEAQASQFDLAYVALDGNIGCMVNGAGLAMATMDIIQHYGGKPANFLDVGGGASQEKIKEGFKIILSDTHVKAILINIFGGIMNCETMALGIIEAAKELQIHVPLVVRMEGTNVERGKQLLEEAKLNIIIAKDLSDAARKVVEAIRDSNTTSTEGRKNYVNSR